MKKPTNSFGGLSFCFILVTFSGLLPIDYINRISYAFYFRKQPGGVSSINFVSLLGSDFCFLPADLTIPPETLKNSLFNFFFREYTRKLM